MFTVFKICDIVLGFSYFILIFFLFRMRYLAAYLLASLGGATPDKATVEKILEAGGVDCDAARVAEVIKALDG